MGSGRYLPFLPIMLNWIQQTLDTDAGKKRPVAAFGFPRLPHYFSKELLNSASIVITDSLPRPPLSALGLSEGGVAGFGIAFSIPYRPRIGGAPPEPDPRTQTADRSAIPRARLHTGLAAVLPLPKRTREHKMTRDLTEEVHRVLDISRKERPHLWLADRPLFARRPMEVV